MSRKTENIYDLRAWLMLSAAVYTSSERGHGRDGVSIRGDLYVAEAFLKESGEARLLRGLTNLNWWLFVFARENLSKSMGAVAGAFGMPHF